MGKAVSQASHSISKNDRKHVDSLLKVLRPKVYITDSSSFKKLVQELTGNGNRPAAFTPPPPKQEQLHHHVEADSSVELSFDSSESSNPMLSPFTAFTGFESSWMSLNSHAKQEQLYHPVPVEQHVEADSSVELSFDSSDSGNQMLSSLDAYTGLQSSWTSVNSHASLPCEEFNPLATELDPFALFSDCYFPSVDPIYSDYSYHNEQGICVSDYDYDYSELFNGL